MRSAIPRRQTEAWRLAALRETASVFPGQCLTQLVNYESTVGFECDLGIFKIMGRKVPSAPCTICIPATRGTESFKRAMLIFGDKMLVNASEC